MATFRHLFTMPSFRHACAEMAIAADIYWAGYFLRS